MRGVDVIKFAPMKKIEKSLRAGVVAVAALSACAVEAKVTTATPFADNMVLQRNCAVPVWGTADAGETVTVSFAGQAKSATADAKGAWRVALDPLPASKENRVLKVSGSANMEEIKNVLVGEVWFASGQSNMECPIWGPSPRYRDGQGAVMTASARRPFIRYAKNGRVWKTEPRYDWKAEWRDFSPASFKATFNYNLSAVAFYYALELYDALDVPVGIIDSSWGGTCIETWTPPCSFQTPPEVSATDKRAHQQPTALWNGMVAAWAPFAIKGFIWYQGCSNAGQGRRYSKRMHALYDGWAKEFQNPDLKLYFVQLAPWSRSWFEVQQGQAIFEREEKNAGMAVTCDVGNSWDIHPNDKESVARRLALHALKRDYGFDGIIDNSPTLREWKIEGDTFVMSFNDATEWYVYNADYSGVQGFEIAGPDGEFKQAKVLNANAGGGRLKGAELVVKADGISNPRCLRYLASKPWIGALYSLDSGLPLGPFEADARTPDLPSKLGDALKVPELEGFRTVYVADIPPAGKFEAGNYSVDNAAKAGAFARVAYVMELVCDDDSVDWAVAAMDAFTNNAAMLGVPAVTKAFFQQKVGNLVVRSNRKCVKEGPQEGVIEFFNSNYSQGARLAGIGGSSKVFDFNDAAGGLNPGYGCLQIHDWKNGTTIMAYNNFNANGAPDIGIGNNVEGTNPDWTFVGNAGDYKARRLTILAK